MICLATNYQTDSANSRSRFAQFVEPALRAFGFRDVVSTEKQDSELKRLLDFAGVDALAKDKHDSIVTLASRIIEVKPYGGDYDCFSVRNARVNGYKTEDEKLRRAIEKNSLRPMWHCQTFIDETSNSANVGIVRTRDLMNFIAKHTTKTKKTRDGTEFHIADWNDMKLAGVDVRTKKISL